MMSAIATDPSSPSLSSERSSKRHVRPRKNFTKDQTQVLKDWLVLHKEHPYPSDQEKKQLCMATGLSKK